MLEKLQVVKDSTLNDGTVIEILRHKFLTSFGAFFIVSHSYLLLTIDADYFPKSKYKRTDQKIWETNWNSILSYC